MSFVSMILIERANEGAKPAEVVIAWNNSWSALVARGILLTLDT